MMKRGNMKAYIHKHGLEISVALKKRAAVASVLTGA